MASHTCFLGYLNWQSALRDSHQSAHTLCNKSFILLELFTHACAEIATMHWLDT